MDQLSTAYMDRRFASSGSEPFLINLPTEIILLILNQVNESDCRVGHINDIQATCSSTFYNLVLTCRYLYHLALPFLYTTVASRPGYYQTLLQTITAKPTLMKKVEHINWTYNVSDDLGSVPLLRPSKDQQSTICAALMSLKGPNGNSGEYESIRNPRKSGDYLAAILCLAPNIQCLDLHDESMRRSLSIYDILSYETPAWINILVATTHPEPTCNLPHGSFQNLRQISLRMGFLKLADLYPIFGIPSLRVLRLHEVIQRRSFLQKKKWANLPRSSSIQELRLSSAYMDARAVLHVLQLIRSLHVFTFDFNTEHMARLGVPPHAVHHYRMHYPTLASALSLHDKTLETLDLSDSRPQIIQLLDYSTRGTLSFLHSMKNLTTLNVSLDAFLGPLFALDSDDVTGKVPLRLHKLGLLLDVEHITDGEDWIPQLAKLARFLKPSIPELTHVDVYRVPTETKLYDSGKLGLLFWEKGVKLEFHTGKMSGGSV